MTSNDSADTDSTTRKRIQKGEDYALRWHGRDLLLTGTQVMAALQGGKLSLASLVKQDYQWIPLETAFSDFDPPQIAITSPPAGSRQLPQTLRGSHPGSGSSYAQSYEAESEEMLEPDRNWNGLNDSPGRGHASSPFENDKEVRHSRLGVTSFIISLSVGVLFLIFVVMAHSVISKLLRGEDVEGQFVAVSMSFWLLVGAAVTALGLGIGGIAQSTHKRLFAILGTVFSAVFLIIVAALMLLS